jgi:hypothetical protein
MNPYTLDAFSDELEKIAYNNEKFLAAMIRQGPAKARKVSSDLAGRASELMQKGKQYARVGTAGALANQAANPGRYLP